MTYEETLTYLYEQLPMYQRVGQAAYKVDLNNTKALLEKHQVTRRPRIRPTQERTY